MHRMVCININFPSLIYSWSRFCICSSAGLAKGLQFSFRNGHHCSNNIYLERERLLRFCTSLIIVSMWSGQRWWWKLECLEKKHHRPPGSELTNFLKLGRQYVLVRFEPMRSDSPCSVSRCFKRLNHQGLQYSKTFITNCDILALKLIYKNIEPFNKTHLCYIDRTFI